MGFLACGDENTAPTPQTYDDDGPPDPRTDDPPRQDAGARPDDPNDTDAAPPPNDADTEPGPGTIAFVCEHDDGDNDELCVMDADGGRVRRLTQNAGPDRAPSWSPDGKQLIFNSRRAPHADRPQIYRLDLEAKAITRVSNSALEDHRGSWAPDGTAVVFQRGTFAQGFELYRQTLADGALVALTNEPGTINAAGSYSPDASRLLFQSNRDAEEMFPFSSYVLTFATGAVTQIAASVTASHDGPRWSPDGSRIVLSAGGDLHLLTVANGSVETLTDDDHSDSAPAWSPDGRALVFQSDRLDEDRTSLHILDLETRAIVDLGFGRTPVWTARSFAADELNADGPGAGDPCAPHGSLHDDHCHCDPGYVEVGLSCVAVVVESCGAGHRHGDSCVCYAGHIYDPASDTCAVFTPPAAQPPPSFLVVALGEPDTNSGMNATNDHLQVVGNKRPAGQTFLSAYTQPVLGSAGAFTAGAVTDVGILPRSSNQFSRPWDINWYGVIVGESGNNNLVLPFVYVPGNGLRQLKLPTGASGAVAHGINDAGRIVGIGNSRAIAWSSSHATPTYLPSHTGAANQSSRAWKLNEHGDIVGHARDAQGAQRATWWKSDGGMVDLGTLNPAHASEALGINGHAQIIGKSFVGVVPGSASGTLQTQGFVYENGSMRGLGLLPSAPNALHSTANAINDEGWIVGQVEQIAGLAARAVLWRDGVIVDLNDFLPADSGWVLTSAVDINSHGDIVGRGTYNGASRPFALIRTH